MSADCEAPEFIDRLQLGDAAAYRLLVRRFHGSLVGLAASVTGSRALGEEVVQDSWVAVLGAIGGFERRSSLASWLFRIVLNRARTRVAREGRMVSLAAEEEEPADERGRFKPDGHWAEAPRLWDVLDAERIVSGRQLWQHVRAMIEALPAGQKAVIILRDIEGQSAEDACRLLEISAENQRVLLHRARDRIRRRVDALVK